MNNFSKLVGLAFVLIIGISIFYILSGNSQNLDVNLAGPNEIEAGVPFDLKVEFSNQLNSVIKNVSLIISLPDGAVFAGSNEEKLVDSKSLGDLGQGSMVSEDYKVVFLNGIGDVKKIKALVSYSAGSSKYEQEVERGIKLTANGIDVEYKAPDKVFSGEEFEVDVNYKNNSDADFYGLELTMDYPANLTYSSASPKPDTGNNVWDLGDLRKGSSGSFKIKGSVAGPDNSPAVFKSKLKILLNDKNYFLNLNDVNLSISPSPLSLSVLVNDKQDYVAGTNDNLKYVISYVNSTDIPLRDVVVRAQLKGDLFNLDSLDTKASFNSSNNTLTWNSSNSSELNSVAPKSAGFVSFSVKTKSNYPIRRLGDKDFLLNVKAEIESPTVPEYLNASKTYNLLSAQTKVAGSLSLSAKGYFRDAQSGILNKGTMPPKVGQPVNFTIHWFLNSLATDFSNIEVRAPLKPGVKFTGVAKSDFGNAPVFDDKTNEMVWTLNKLQANQGFVDGAAEAIFQVEATPNSSQIANYMPLIGESTVKATDAFTSNQVESKIDQITTALPSDTSVGQQGGVVQP